MRAKKKPMPMLALVATVLTLTSGCLFDTRQANDPGGAGSTWQVPTVPSRVFINLKSGLEELNGANYEKSIHDNFTFEPLPEDFSDPTLQGKFDNWTADVEKAVLQRLLSESSAIEVTFANQNQIRDQSPFADFNTDYTLIRTSNTVPAIVDTFKGKAQFDMIDDSKGWQLIRWVDIERVSGFPTWGYLRGTLRQ